MQIRATGDWASDPRRVVCIVLVDVAFTGPVNGGGERQKTNSSNSKRLIRLLAFPSLSLVFRPTPLPTLSTLPTWRSRTSRHPRLRAVIVALVVVFRIPFFPCCCRNGNGEVNRGGIRSKTLENNKDAATGKISFPFLLSPPPKIPDSVSAPSLSLSPTRFTGF